MSRLFYCAVVLASILALMVIAGCQSTGGGGYSGGDSDGHFGHNH